MRVVSRALLALCVSGCAVAGPALVAHAAGSGSSTTAPDAEGWHRTAPVCALPTGCPDAAPSPYAPDTLHVGVNAGQEEARTTLRLDLGVLPPGTKPVGGLLTLPVAAGTSDGTRNASAAKLRACAVVEPVEDVDGSFAPAPKADCELAAADAVFVPATATTPAAFTVDLAALATSWQSGDQPGALAVVPGEVAPTDTWHVAFSDRSRTGDGVALVSASVSFVSASRSGAFVPPADVAPAAPEFVAPPSTGSGDVFVAPGGDPVAAPAFAAPADLPALPTQEQPAVAGAAVPVAAAPPAVVPVAAVVDSSFRYPAVFLLPLLLAGAVAWAGRALTRDLNVT